MFGLFGAGAAFVALVALALAIGSFGFGTERLTAEAQAALSRLAGQEVKTRLGPARVSLDQASLVALEVQDLAIAQADAPGDVIQAGKLRFGVRIFPLFAGKLELGSATLSDARLNLAAWKGNGERDWRALLEGGGIVAPDALLDAAFAGIHAAIDSLGNSAAAGFNLSNVEIALPAGSRLESVVIRSARIRREGQDALAMTGEVALGARVLTFEGKASRADGDNAGARFSIELASVPDRAIELSENPEDPDGPQFVLGHLNATLRGTQPAKSDRGTITANVEIGESLWKTRNALPVRGDGKLAAILVPGSNKIELSMLQVASGRSRLAFTGAIGPVPLDDQGVQEPLYRFELVSPGSIVAPEDANEPALMAAVRVAGRITANGMRVIGDEVRVATNQGDIYGSGSLDIRLDQTPGVSLALAVPRLPVAYVKSIWPWFAAPAARTWALANVFGGTIENSRLLLNAPPGSFGPDDHLGPDQVSGHFEVSGARFDVTGTIPPVRDAVGIIDFAGTDVDIQLKSGTVFMPSGRTLAARNGTFRIANAHLKPLVGDLDIDVEGEAGAAAEIVTYEPINIARYIDLPPKDLTGQVKGHIQAGIPLQKSIDPKELRWQVDLAYSGLSIAEPFEGQLIEDAEGTIVARPEEARIEARAKANGVPAAFSLVEPLEGDRSGRVMKARLTVDNASRDRLLPGMSRIISGPFAVDIETVAKGKQKVAVDLRQANLSLPWIGWRKGAGVPARASFQMDTTGEATSITNFELTGETFGASGSMKLDRDGLASARFSRIALNRGDDASATLDRRRKGYAVAVSGNSFDARPVIRRFSHFAKGGTPEGDDDDDVAFSIDADVAQVSGFNGERLSGLKLVYSDAAEGGGLRATAATPAGARVTVVDATAGGNRKIEMQAGDAGTVLRFLDVYANLRGGSAVLTLSGPADGALRGQLEARDFALLNEEKLNSIVSQPPPGSDRSLNQAVRRDIDLTRASFDQGFAALEKGDGYLTISNGVVRGDAIGATFQGTVFDRNNNMSITGTFMPAYGLNRLFGEIPIIGQILGNGRDRGLIGITFRFAGKTSEPKLEVNPLSIVAPGIFRSIFEYR